jgi:hypothetical protein
LGNAARGSTSAARNIRPQEPQDLSGDPQSSSSQHTRWASGKLGIWFHLGILLTPLLWSLNDRLMSQIIHRRIKKSVYSQKLVFLTSFGEIDKNNLAPHCTGDWT